MEHIQRHLWLYLYSRAAELKILAVDSQLTLVRVNAENTPYDGWVVTALN